MMWTISGRSDVFLEALEQLVICSRGSDYNRSLLFQIAGIVGDAIPSYDGLHTSCKTI